MTGGDGKPPRQSRDQAHQTGGKPQAQRADKAVSLTLPSPTLPKGGGAIAPIGDKLVPNPQMGTASFVAPVFTSAGRGGFGPKLELSHSSGGGNTPFGLGLSL